MPRKPTVTQTDDIDLGIHRALDRAPRSPFIEDPVHPNVVTDEALDAEYRAMAADAELERDALEWIEWSPDEKLA